MKTIQIEAYDYNDLDEAGKASVRVWLDEGPVDVENDAGEAEFRNFSYMTDIEIAEDCQAIDYIFTKSRRHIHHFDRQLA